MRSEPLIAEKCADWRRTEDETEHAYKITDANYFDEQPEGICGEFYFKKGIVDRTFAASSSCCRSSVEKSGPAVAGSNPFRHT